MTPEQALIVAYRRAALQLRQQAQDAFESGQLGTAAYRSAQHERALSVLRGLDSSTKGLALQVPAAPYRVAAEAVDAGGGAPRAVQAFGFTGSHTRAVGVLADGLATRLDRATSVVGRRVDDAFRRVGLEQVAQGVAAGATRREVAQAIGHALIDEEVTDALTGFVDRAGRRWQLDTYANMVARTTTREAVTLGTANRMLETGQQLITISSHGTTTPICIPYEGNTYALPGQEVEGYETIDQLPPFHPGCEHFCTPAEANLDAFLESLARDKPSAPAGSGTLPGREPSTALPPSFRTPPRTGDRVSFSGGVDPLRPTRAIRGGRGTIVEVKGELAMLNAGTATKPRWVQVNLRDVTLPRARAALDELPTPKTFDEPTLSATRLRQHLNQSRAMLDDDAREAVGIYTGRDKPDGELFITTNHNLRSGRRPSAVALRIDRAFEQVHPTTQPGVIYRGTGIRHMGGRLPTPGTVLHDKGFSSATARRSVADAFARSGNGAIVEIEVPPGARLLDINRLAGSEYAGESEILPPRGTRLVVTKVIERKGKPAIIKARMVLE